LISAQVRSTAGWQPAPRGGIRNRTGGAAMWSKTRWKARTRSCCDRIPIA